MSKDPRRSHGELSLGKEETVASGRSEDEETDYSDHRSTHELRDRKRKPRFAPAPPSQLYHSREHPATQSLRLHETASTGSTSRPNPTQRPRGSDQSGPATSTSRPHPISNLGKSMAGFCSLGTDQIASCVTYCAAHSELWDSPDTKVLPNVARELCQISNEVGALQAISRYVMLTEAAKAAETRRGRIEWLRGLENEHSELRKRFNAKCKTLFTNLRDPPPQASLQREDLDPPSRHTKRNSVIASSSALARGSEKTQDLPVRDRRFSVASGSRGAAPQNVPPPLDAFNPLPNFRAKPLPAAGDASDIDTASVPGGQAFAGQSGPRSVIVAGWSPNVQDKLRLDFKLHKGKPQIDRVFGVGSMISVFWHEAQGSPTSLLSEKFSQVPKEPTVQNLGKGFLSQGPKGELIYSHVRRFVIVIQRAGHSIGIPITSYSSQGLSAKKLSENEQRAHAVIYALGNTPVELQSEPAFTKHVICVDLAASGETLSDTSRLYYAKPQSIDHNIKVKYLGKVIAKHIPVVVGSFRNELLGTNL